MVNSTHSYIHTLFFLFFFHQAWNSIALFNAAFLLRASFLFRRRIFFIRFTSLDSVCVCVGLASVCSSCFFISRRLSQNRFSPSVLLLQASSITPRRGCVHYVVEALSLERERKEKSMFGWWWITKQDGRLGEYFCVFFTWSPLSSFQRNSPSYARYLNNSCKKLWSRKEMQLEIKNKTWRYRLTTNYKQ